MSTPLLRAKHSKKVVAEEIVTHLPAPFGRFVDGSLTDAAVFAVQPRTPARCLLNTTDPDLLALLTALRDDPIRVTEEAKILWEDTSREEYESIAAADLPADPSEAGAQLLYLNQLSQPGTTKYDPANKAAQLDWGLVTLWAELLGKVKFSADEPYERLDSARPTDLVYLDTITGLDLEPALNVGADSPAKVAIIDSGGLAEVEAPSCFQKVTLSRCRPGLRTPDVLYLKSE